MSNDNPLMDSVEEDLNKIRDKVESEGQLFAGLAIYAFATEETDVLDKAAVSLSYSKHLPRETQRAMLKVAYKLIGTILNE